MAPIPKTSRGFFSPSRLAVRDAAPVPSCYVSGHWRISSLLGHAVIGRSIAHGDDRKTWRAGYFGAGRTGMSRSCDAFALSLTLADDAIQFCNKAPIASGADKQDVTPGKIPFRIPNNTRRKPCMRTVLSLPLRRVPASCRGANRSIAGAGANAFAAAPSTCCRPRGWCRHLLRRRR